MYLEFEVKGAGTVRRVGIAGAAVALLALAVSSPFAAENKTEPHDDFGVSLAIGGEEARAESVFVSMLSHTRGDARALNNLGNIRLLRGESGVALAFYDRAIRGDSLDAGIYLNRATALMLMGDTKRSDEAFQTGVKMAGGLDKATALLNLPPENAPVDRGAKKTAINPEQLRSMLKKAAASVPKDQIKVVDSEVASAPKTKQNSAWRSAGARASDGSEAPMLLYWKR
jgi:tetratricopeptide (TPR) repeat protein